MSQEPAHGSALLQGALLSIAVSGAASAASSSSQCLSVVPAASHDGVGASTHGDAASSAPACDGGIGEGEDGAMPEECLVDELAKWLAENDGRYPRKQTREQQKGSEQSSLQHRLFLFVRRQKEALSKGKGSEPLEEHVRQLPNVSLVTHDALWNEKYNALRQFLAGAEHPCAPAYPKRNAADAEEKKLASWINQQRKVHQAGQLCGEREQLLYQLRGWRWADHESPWFDMYTQLSSWIGRGGDLQELAAQPSRKFRGEKCDLANWVQQQRDGFRRKNKRSISALQIGMLQEVDPDKDSDFPFPVRSDLSWDDYYAVLEWWGTQYDGFPSPNDDVDHPQHGWIPLGNFYEWSTRAMWLDDAGAPVEGRHPHRLFPAVLNAEQKAKIRSWVAGRAEEPRKKRPARHAEEPRQKKQKQGGCAGPGVGLSDKS